MSPGCAARFLAAAGFSRCESQCFANERFVRTPRSRRWYFTGLGSREFSRPVALGIRQDVNRSSVKCAFPEMTNIPCSIIRRFQSYALVRESCGERTQKRHPVESEPKGTGGSESRVFISNPFHPSVISYAEGRMTTPRKSTVDATRSLYTVDFLHRACPPWTSSARLRLSFGRRTR